MLYITYKFFVWAKFETKIFEQIITKVWKLFVCLRRNQNKYVLGKYEYAAWRLHQLRRRNSSASLYELLSMIELFQSHKQTSWTFFSLGSAWSRSTTKKWCPPVFKLLVPIKVFKICKGSCWWLFEKIFQRTRWTEIFWLTWNICIILYTSVVQLSNWKNVNLYE